MAKRELTGVHPDEVSTLQGQYYNTPLFEKTRVPFEVAYCLRKIAYQPEEYDGPQRICKSRASLLTEEEWNERYDDEFPTHHNHDNWDRRMYAPQCKKHGRNVGTGNPENLCADTAAITHGIYAEDEHLQMDFDDAEQTLYDAIMEQWPEIYDWPAEGEDPARYEMLDMVATNVVRRRRAEDYLDEEGEVHFAAIYEDGIEVGQEPEENPVAGEYRLLIREITQLLKELGLTPKEQASLGAEKQSADALSTISDVAADALGGDHDYDPNRFDGSTDEPDDT